MDLLVAIIPALITGGATAYSAHEKADVAQQQINAQQQAQRQAQQQSMMQQRQAARADAPSLQSQTSGFLPSSAFQGQLAAVTGNPNFGLEGLPPSGGAGGGSLTPAIENLFPTGGVPSLTDPYPTNV
ncbi:MAG: hypothetical protein C5B60_09780 [Chloroflexi bacterium]|nr:MAG: hypothetical protein C5B60_09780 [Chloroflexota bacterium]